MATSVEAFQLLYTNVEADQSPTRQRGFQVWLASPELSAEQRRLTARRLDDFRVPPGAGSRAESIERHAYFSLPDENLFVVARTVPSKERDKFGRGGKFHAHAVLLSRDVFESLGCDPFRIIDGGFPFHSSPAEAQADEAWKTGQLPLAVLPVAPVTPPTHESPGLHFTQWIEHVERNDEKPLVVAESPERVLALLRNSFGALPPCLRATCSFDTLSTGASLGQLRYALVGAFSPDNLRTWASRRYHRLDLASGECTPPLPSFGNALPVSLIGSAGWSELSDVEREATFQLARALREQRFQSLDPDMLTPAAQATLLANPAFSPALEAAIQARVSLEVPPGFASLPAVMESTKALFQGSPIHSLGRLREAIPRECIANGLYQSLSASTISPSPKTLDELGAWLAAGTARTELEHIFLRWRGDEADLQTIELDLASTEPDTEQRRWFRTWLASTLPANAVDSLTARLDPGRKADAVSLRDARLFLALQHKLDSQAAAELRLRVALHRGAEHLLRELQNSHEADWLARMLTMRSRDRLQPVWINDPLTEIILGFALIAQNEVDEVLFEVASDVRDSIAKSLLSNLQSGSAPPALSAIIDLSTAPPPMSVLYNRVMEAEPRKLPAAVDSLREHLRTTDDESFRWVGNQLLEKAYGVPTFQPLTEDVVAVGLKLIWVVKQRLPQQEGVFEALAGACAERLVIGQVPAAARPQQPSRSRRFNWLLTRLADPNNTERLRI